MKSFPSFVKKTIPEGISVDWELFEKAHQEAPITSIRLNPKKLKHEFLDLTKIPWCDNGYYLADRPNFTADPLFHAGCYYVQEASSMFLEVVVKQLLHLEKDLRVLDLCAAPGGKSTLLASLLSPQSLLISNEVIQARVGMLNENVIKWGFSNHWVTNSDASAFNKLPNYFDAVVIDAPCSGSGLFRKMPEYADQITPENILQCANRQKRILHDSYQSLAQDGILIYMTCSYSVQENEDMLDYMCEQFDLVSCPLDIPAEWNIVETQSEKAKAYGYRFFPHLLQGEGFFIACFKKMDGELKSVLPFTKSKESFIPELKSYMDITEKVIYTFQDYTIVLAEQHLSDLILLQKKVKLIKKGLLLGKIIRKELIPDHELAMSNDLLPSFDHFNLQKSDALLFLKKEPLTVPVVTKGWIIVAYQDIPLGWIKNLGNRINNYYPSNYRILSKNI